MAMAATRSQAARRGDGVMAYDDASRRFAWPIYPSPG